MTLPLSNLFKRYLILAFVIVFHFAQSQDKGAQISEYVASYANTQDFSGCILVEQAGEILYKQCFGEADIGFSIPNSPETRFMIGSVSKQFTAAAILKLQEMGKLNVEDPLLKYFHGNSNLNGITVHHLLSHRSGLADIYTVENFNTLSCKQDAFPEVVDGVLNTSLAFEPGSTYQYSNGNYAVLATIIENVSGMEYGDFIRKTLLEPMELNNTGHPISGQVTKMLADGYEPEGYEDLRPTDYLDPDLLKGGGSLYSTIGDMLKWINQIRDGDFLKPESYAQWLTNHGSNYGYGISVYKSFDQDVFGHDGRLNGYIADYLHYRDTNTSIIILGNVQTGVSDFFRRDIAAIVFGKEYKSSAKTDTPLQDGITDYKPFTGKYGFGPNFKVYIELLDGKLMARANEGGYSELVALDDGRFFSRTLYAFISFEQETVKGYEKLKWTTNDGNSFTGTREQ